MNKPVKAWELATVCLQISQFLGLYALVRLTIKNSPTASTGGNKSRESSGHGQN